MPVHYMHDLDRKPLCWTLPEVDSKSTAGVSQTNDEKKVTCTECIAYLEED